MRYPAIVQLHQLCCTSCRSKIISSHFSAGKRQVNNMSSATKDLVTEIEVLGQNSVQIKNRDRVNTILNKIIDGGSKRLHVVFDFDRTITKQHHNGKPQATCFGIFSQCKTLPKDFASKDKELTAKYHPIEVDPTIPVSEKRIIMEEWWQTSNQLLKGLTVSRKDIDDVVANDTPQLRDGCVDTFTTLDKLNVPVLVFSAGLGDCVESVLRRYNIIFPSVKIVSNFLIYDETGKTQGFNGSAGYIINVYNKNEDAIKGTDYYDIIGKRENVILLGDSIGDATMADGKSQPNALLKIGFLYDRIEESLSNYMEIFDIVLVDDQTMDVLNAILEYLR